MRLGKYSSRMKKSETFGGWRLCNESDTLGFCKWTWDTSRLETFKIRRNQAKSMPELSCWPNSVAENGPIVQMGRVLTVG